MEFVKFFSTSTCIYLEKDIENNIDWYFGDIESEEPKGMSLPYSVKESEQIRKKPYSDKLSKIDLSFDKPIDADIEASLLVYSSLQSINKEQATSRRLWAYENHQNRNYIAMRWMKSMPYEKTEMHTEKAIKDIKKHYFDYTPRGMIRTNATARLWHNGYYANSVDGENPRRFLEVIIKNADLRASIIERPGISRNLKIMSAIYNVILEHRDSRNSTLMERDNYREWFKQINAVGGVKVLDAMREDDLVSLFSEEAEKVLYIVR